MLDELKRTAYAAAGGMVGATIVALVEARTMLHEAGSHPPPWAELVLADLGVLAPVALLASLGVAAAHLFLEPEGPHLFTSHLARANEEPVLQRSRTAAIWPLAVLVALGWTLTTAHLARAELAHGAPLASGLSLAVRSAAVLVAFVAAALAVVPWLRRGLAAGAWLVNPVLTGGVALAFAVIVVAAGVWAGDTGGDGAWPIGILGVLKRRELDLRPVANLLVIAAGAYLAPVMLHRDGRGDIRAIAAVTFALVPLFVTVREARALGTRPTAARALERHAPLGKVGLTFARAATDKDRDGASPLFGGGDCDDRDRKKSPTAIDVPGNGVDEDCSGADLAPPPPPPPPPPPKGPSDDIPDDLNLVFITVDTLRPDTGFMGYEKDTTPNLDKLAEKSVIFERAYSMASYTGKSLAPILIGKYPNETDRDGNHFNVYMASNTFVPERMKTEGVFTMGAAPHWYFAPWFGLPQGIEKWDMSARPGEGQGDNDTSVTSKELADACIRLLSKKDYTDRRFFFWAHFFDPHAQYMPHPGAPDFAEGARGGTAIAKAQYDTEVWFTDKHIGRLLDFIESQPWGAKTAFIVTADHGEAFADHGMSYHGVELWESLVRVPLVVYVPGVPPHRVPVKRGQIDLAPTMLEIMKMPQPPAGDLRGTSLVPDLFAKDPYVERDVYLDMPAGPYNQMRRGIITGPTPGMKLIHYGAASYQLFDLAADPGEKEDLSHDKDRLAPVLTAFQSLRSTLKEKDVKPADPDPDTK